MPNGNAATTKWLIALAVTAGLAMGGWTYGATQAARLRMVDEVKGELKRVQELGVQNDRRIYVLEEKFRTIFMSLEEIKGLIRQHEEKSK